jgi:hypothetical protein
VADDETDNARRAIERVTIAEAAALLGCHPNTVRSRVKTGIYRAEKFHTENGPTWMIERESLTTNAPTTARQQGVSGVPALQQEALQELARQIVRQSRLSSDPEQEAVEKRREQFIEGGREYYKTMGASFKDAATLSGATLVAFTVVTKAFMTHPDPYGRFIYRSGCCSPLPCCLR